MVAVTISENIKGRLETSKHEFKSQRNAFMAAHNAARYFWIDYSDEEFPVENIDGDKWHFEPLPGVTMDVKLESEETSELSI